MNLNFINFIYIGTDLAHFSLLLFNCFKHKTVEYYVCWQLSIVHKYQTTLCGALVSLRFVPSWKASSKQ